MPIEHSTPNVPRNFSGDNSAMYIGIMVVVKPDARPTTNRAIISIMTEFAIRQKKNKMALTTNRDALANNDRFLKIRNRVFLSMNDLNEFTFQNDQLPNLHLKIQQLHQSEIQTLWLTIKYLSYLRTNVHRMSREMILCTSLECATELLILHLCIIKGKS